MSASEVKTLTQEEERAIIKQIAQSFTKKELEELKRELDEMDDEEGR